MACKICKKPLVSSENGTLQPDGKPHICEICGKSFSLKIQLKRHLLTHEDNNVQPVCSSCEKNSDENRSYNLRLSQKGNFKCETCEKSFPSQRLLLRHASKHTLENVFSCEECGDIFKTVSALKRHSTVHKIKKEVSKINASKKESKTSYVCEECNKSFTSLPQYHRHCNTHQKFKCDLCHTIYKSKKLLDNHKKNGKCNSDTEHNDMKASLNTDNVDSLNPVGKRPTCFVCNISFARKSALEGHMLTHLIDNKESGVEDDSDYDIDFVCNLNGSKIEQQPKPLQLPKLKISRTQHQCDKCDVVCATKKSLHVHMLMHENDADNSNVASNNKVADNSKIADKSNVVENGKEIRKNYICRFCNDKFNSKEDYKKHKLTTHNLNLLDVKREMDKEQKIYTCKICSKDFSKRKHLKRHLRNHVAERNSDNTGTFLSGKRQKRVKNFSCSFCGKLFAGEICLKKHEAKHADGDKDESSSSKLRKSKKAKILICEICKEEFTGRRHVYVKHKLSHTPEVCGICDERFADRASLREHCKIHIGTEEGRRFVECSQKALDAKNGIVPPEPKVEYIYLVLR